MVAVANIPTALFVWCVASVEAVGGCAAGAGADAEVTGVEQAALNIY